MEKKKLQKPLLLLAFLVLASVWFYDHYKEQHIRINEVCSNNFVAGQDENGEYSDCVELYNPGTETVSLDDCFLTDDVKEPNKYSLEGLSVPAGGFVLVWLHKEDGLRISKDGETLFLVDGAKDDCLDQVTVPRLDYDTSYGRIRDGKSRWSVMRTTLGSSNDEADMLPEIALAAPVFEKTSGFYEDAFSLSLYSPQGEKIYYTLDGSEPGIDSMIYRGPIRITDNSADENRYAARTDLSPTKDYVPDFPVDKAVVVRAACYNPVTNLMSETVTETFFVGYDKRTEYEGLAVISLTVDPDDLFDAETGIYGNGAEYEKYLADGGRQEGEVLDDFVDAEGETRHRYMASNAFYRGREWERKASLIYFDEEHDCSFTQTVGIRIAGNSTRGVPQKSLNLFVRNIYGDGEIIPYTFFDDETYYNSVKIRNGGGNWEGVKFLDAFLEEAAGIRDSVSIQRAKPCAVFLNGEYWGIYSIRERYDEEFLAARYGLNSDDIMLVKSGNAVTHYEETTDAYKYMREVITECDLAYEDTYALAEELVDIQSLIDYCCVNLYLDNRDVGFGYNTALWRTTQEGTAYSDGQWRFMFYDMDECIFEDSNTWENRENWMEDNELFSDPMIQSLLDNEGFRQQFCISFMDTGNFVFSYERMHEMLAEWNSVYGLQVVKDHQRFCDSEYDREDFLEQTAKIDAFFAERFPFAMESLVRTFQLSGELSEICVSSNMPEGGTFTVNTIQLADCSAWEGYYYSDFPVTISVHAGEGYRFLGWQGAVEGTEDTISFYPESGAMEIEAVFEKVP